MNSNFGKLFLLLIFILTLLQIPFSEEVNLTQIYNLTMTKETLNKIKEETIEVEKLRIHQKLN